MLRAWDDTISLLTYPLGSEDPNPPFQRQNRSNAIYPYTMLDDVLDAPPQERSWTALHIENDYLHAIVLPDLGGHLYSVYDKVSGRELFYRNHVVKYGLVATRGAWVSGGIEFNFPMGHTYTTVSPVSWEMGEDDEGVWIAVGNICRLSRMEWWVKLILEPDQRRLRERIWLHNRTPLPQRFWFWNNSAVPATDDLHLVYPARKVQIGGKILDYPVHEGLDLSWYKNRDAAGDIFTLDVTEGFFGCHYVDSDFGMVNVADPWEVEGRKFFTWGTCDEGMIWVNHLTDSDGQYVEIQSGRFETQSIWEFLPAGGQITWEEHWMPEHGMGGWVCANADAVLNFELRDGRVRLGALTTALRRNLLLSLETGGEVVWSQELTGDPRKPFQITLKQPAHHGPDTEYSLVLSDPFEEHEIIRYVHPPLRERRPKPSETGESVLPTPLPEAECGAEELCVRATNALRRQEHNEVRRLAQAALAIDPGCARAHTLLGLLDCRAALWESARDHLQQAVLRDKEPDDSWQALGLARWQCGDADGARLALREAYRRGCPEGAESLLWHIEDRETGVSPWEGPLDPAEALPFLIGLDRAAGEPRDESDEDRLERFAHWARGDVNLWLEEAFAADEVGAVSLLEHAREACPDAENSPMLHYCLAYWYAALDDPEAAARALANARRCPLDFCFPSRVEELPVLQSALAADPNDWHARYLLGNLLAALGRTQEALGAWRRALATPPAAGQPDPAGFAVLQRNIALGARLWEQDFATSADHYRRAIACNPEDYRYYLDLADLYTRNPEVAPPAPAVSPQTGAPPDPEPAVLALLQSAPEAVQDKWQVAARMAEALGKVGRFDEALAILRGHRFFPWEGARHMHAVWAQCLSGRAAQHTAEGDHAAALADLEEALTYPRNLGVGKPAHPQDARLHWLAAEAAGALAASGSSHAVSSAAVGESDVPGGVDLAAVRAAHLTAAADEVHPQPCEADRYRILALRALGRDQEADDLEKKLPPSR
jgi:tetratricopeptide (TPR) repeat protein